MCFSKLNVGSVVASHLLNQRSTFTQPLPRRNNCLSFPKNAFLYRFSFDFINPREESGGKKQCTYFKNARSELSTNDPFHGAFQTQNFLCQCYMFSFCSQQARCIKRCQSEYLSSFYTPFLLAR